jgi:hypothetical protein
VAIAAGSGQQVVLGIAATARNSPAMPANTFAGFQTFNGKACAARRKTTAQLSLPVP